MNRSTINADLQAGLIGAIVTLPQAVAFAAIAGLPPQYGLYTCMVPAIIAALFGSSKHLVSGPTTAASIVIFAGLSSFATPESEQYVALAITLTFMVGIIQLAMGFARLGALVNFISHSVVVGFTAGAALLIASHQLKHFLGIHLEHGGHFFDLLKEIFSRLDETNLYVLVVGLSTLVVSILTKKFFPRVPYMIVAILFGSVLAYFFNSNIENAKIILAGDVPGNFPIFAMPQLSLDTLKQLAPLALATTLFALTEAVSIGRSLAIKSGQHVHSNQEFIGQGLSNLVGSFFSAYVATGSFNRSGLNYQIGAKTQLSAIVGGLVLLATIPLTAPLASFMPKAVMAAILFLVAWGLIDFHHIRNIFQTSHSDSVVLVTTFGGTLFLELEFAILLGVLLSLVIFLFKTSQPRVLERVPDPRLPKRRFNTDPNLPTCPQMKIIRIDGELFFGAVSHIQETFIRLRTESPEQKHLMLVASGINFLDVAGAELLAQEAHTRRKMGGGLYLLRIKPGVCEPISKGPYLDEISAMNIFESKGEAIHEVYQLLDKDICSQCSSHIFLECGGKPSKHSTDSLNSLDDLYREKPVTNPQ